MQIINFKNNSKQLTNIIKKITKVLRQGGLVIAPSDTVYAVLADAKNQSAVKKLIQFKERPPNKAISVFIPDIDKINKYVKVNDRSLSILKKILPGPFTIVLKSNHKVLPKLESESGTLGIRIPNYKFIQELVKHFGSPITATSANLSGRSPVYNVKMLLQSLPQNKISLLDLIIDAGKLPYNKPSTVVDLTESDVRIIRQGDISFADRESFVSETPEQTKKFAQTLLKKNMSILAQKPLIFILEGELGVGKTVFVKGIGENLGIKNIVSPTFVIYYEYEINKSEILSSKSETNPKFQFSNLKLIHIDLYNIKEDEEFENLGLEKYLVPGNILCFEWGEKAGKILDLLKQKGKVVYVKMEYIDERKRNIQIYF